MKNFLIILLVILPTFYFGYIGKPTEMGIMVIASSITVAFLNMDKIQKFKGAGFEAEMKKVVDEAYITLDNLKSVALPLITTTIDNISWGKRWGASESDRDSQMFNELLKIIDELKLDNVEIEDAVNKAISITGKPVCIVANTVKGKGVSFMENECGWHGQTPSPEEKEKAINDIVETAAGS